MDLCEKFIILSYSVGCITGVILWEVFLRKHFKKK